MRLKYNNNKFRIVQFTDTHIGSYPFNEDDFKTLDLIERANNSLKPDLIVITGDIIWSDGVLEPHKSLSHIMSKLNEFDTPVMFVYGNHDSEDKTTRHDLWVWEKELKNPVHKANEKIYSEFLRKDFAVEIYNESGSVQTVLYGIDSGADAPVLRHIGGRLGKYDWIKFEQILNFSNVNEKYKYSDVKALVFQHIPLMEFWHGSTNIETGVFEDDDKVSSPVINTGFFAKMVIDGNVLGIFVGHDHDNNFTSDLFGIKMCYGQSTGYHTYGHLEKGVRVIELCDETGDTVLNTYTKKDSEL